MPGPRAPAARRAKRLWALEIFMQRAQRPCPGRAAGALSGRGPRTHRGHLADTLRA
jgi:hypothetical protein